MIKVILLLFIGGSNCFFDFPEQTYNSPELLKPLSYLSKDVYLNYENQGLRSYLQQVNLENTIQRHNISIKNGSISHSQWLDRLPSESSQEINNLALKFLKTSNYFVMNQCGNKNIPSEECIRYLKEKELPNESQLKSECNSIDNEYHSFRRLLPANYKDGLYQMNKIGLPKPLEVSALASDNENTKEDDDNNLAFIQWAQFIEHDLVKAVVTTMHDGDTIECCNSEYFNLLPRYRHPSCEPLESVDIRQHTFDRKSCLNYVRSSLAVNKKCRLGVPEQLNEASSALDLSQLYGYTTEAQIGMKSKGFLKSNGEFLPYAEIVKDFCVSDTEKCYMAGDSRVNANPYTIILYTIFLRNHNQIAKKLTNENSLMTDDEIFTKAKDLNTRIYRDIIFKEWLPILIGNDNMNKLTKEKLKKQTSESFEVSNEFGVAAARFYYSMIPSSQKKNINETTLFNLHDEFYASNLVDKNFDEQIEGILNQKALAMDSTYSNSVLKRYFATKDSKAFISGADALGWDIQIGRDHGLQGYTEYVKACYGIKIKRWSDLSFSMNEEGISKLKTIYSDVNDIDLIIGGIFEKIDKDASVGPTFNCILSWFSL
ncbi:HPX2 family protein [Megaselia abdita]